MSWLLPLVVFSLTIGLHASSTAHAQLTTPGTTGPTKRAGDPRKRGLTQLTELPENYRPKVDDIKRLLPMGVVAPRFLEYLPQAHRNLHKEFARSFLDKLPAGTFENPWLTTTVEIVLQADGSLQTHVSPFSYPYEARLSA